MNDYYELIKLYNTYFYFILLYFILLKMDFDEMMFMKLIIIMLEYNVQIKLCDLILNIEKVDLKKILCH